MPCARLDLIGNQQEAYLGFGRFSDRGHGQETRSASIRLERKGVRGARGSQEEKGSGSAKLHGVIETERG
jgi:hypothetical protein